MSITQTDKGTILVDEADLEYDEEFASLEVNSNVLGIFFKKLALSCRNFFAIF